MRIRSTKPEFWSSEDVAALSRENRLLFLGLWSYVDDNGVGRDDFRLITADLFPLDEPVEARDYVREGLATLSRNGLIARYKIDGRPLIFITGWRHQRVDKPGKPRYPLPPDDWNSPPTSSDGESPVNGARLSRESPASIETGTNRAAPESASATLISSSADQSNGASSESLTSESGDSRESLAPGTEEQRNRGKNSSSRPEPRREDVEALCKHLQDRVIANGCKAPTKAAAEGWRRAARLMLDVDKRDPKQAHQLIDWCQNDDFWRATVRSMPKFREQYDQLRLKSQSSGLRSVPAPPPGPELRTFEDYLSNAAAAAAASLLRIPCVLAEQPPSDRTPASQWQQEARRRWITDHERQLRAALAEQESA